MAYKITVLTSEIRNAESANFQSWKSEPIETGLDMEALESVFGPTEPMMKQTIITDDLNTVVSISKAYYDCPVSSEKI